MRLPAILIPVLFVVSIAGVEDAPGWSFRITGTVVFPDGAPVDQATVTAMTYCNPEHDRYYSEEFVETQSRSDGSFTLEGVAKRCSRLRLQAHKKDDGWLRTDGNLVFPNGPGKAPVIDVADDDAGPVRISVGDRGGELVVRTLDEAGNFWPAIVSIMNCPAHASDKSWVWTSTSYEYPEDRRLLPVGRYCVGLVSASGQYPLQPTCKPVEIRAGHDDELVVLVDPRELTSDVIIYDASCPVRSDDDTGDQ